MANVEFIPEAERRLPVRATGSTVSGSKGNLLWAYRTDPAFRGAVIDKINKRRTNALADAAGCIAGAGRSVRFVSVFSPGRSSAILERRLTERDYPTVKIQNVSFKLHWLCWLVDNDAVATSDDPIAIALLSRFLTQEISHRCGKRGCCQVYHTTIESADDNVSRAVTCHGHRLSNLCPHHPPCIRSPIH